MPIICSIVSTVVIYFISCFNISFLLNKYKTSLVVLIGVIPFSVSLAIPSPFRIVYQIIVLSIIFYIINKNQKKVISAIFFNYFALLILDTLFSIILTLTSVTYNSNIVYILSVIISILSSLLIRSKLFLQLWNIIQNKFEKYIYIFITLILIFLYINISYRYNTINILILIFFILVLIYIIIKELVQSYIIKTETERMLAYIKNYEKQFDEFRINQHEYKNTLVCIKAMIPKNKQAQEFINSILMTNNSDDHDLLKNVAKINISPIKGLVYQKLLLCKEKGIYSVLNVNSVIKFKTANQIDIDTLKDITLILGVLLDNAIESCLETSQKSLSVYIIEEEDEMIFQISNTFKGSVNIDLINKPNYSTKGKNRGYGLALVNQRIKANSKLKLKSEISNDVFIQSLQVKLN